MKTVVNFSSPLFLVNLAESEISKIVSVIYEFIEDGEYERIFVDSCSYLTFEKDCEQDFYLIDDIEISEESSVFLKYVESKIGSYIDGENIKRVIENIDSETPKNKIVIEDLKKNNPEIYNELYKITKDSVINEFNNLGIKIN